MSTFYTDEQVQEAIAALERHSPGIWENVKRTASTEYPLNREQETTLTAVTSAFDVVYPTLSFIALAEDKLLAEHRLNVDIGGAVRAAIASATERH